MLNLDDEVVVRFRGTEKRMRRGSAIDEFLRKLIFSNGPEHSRYLNVYCALSNGLQVCTDEC